MYKEGARTLSVSYLAEAGVVAPGFSGLSFLFCAWKGIYPVMVDFHGLLLACLQDMAVYGFGLRCAVLCHWC